MEEDINNQDEHIIIGRLLAQYPLVTEEEQRVLEKWKIKNSNSQIFDSILETRELDFQRIIAIIEDMETVREKYLRSIPGVVNTKLYWWNNWKMYTAAASIAIALFTAALWFNKGNDNEVATAEQKELPVVHDAAPGKFKAKLVLDDGSVVYLDSAGNKILSPQGNASVTNENGKLIYKSAANRNVIVYNTLTTAKGEIYSLVLADGSTLWLNSQSSVRYPVTIPANGEMEVTITGEVFFDIAHNPKRQFLVTVNGLTIEDIGTQFNVNAYTNEENTKISLVEGSLTVKKRNAAQPLRKGEEAIAGKDQNDNAIQVIDDADMESAIAWKNGLFKFNKNDLKTVMRQLARWYDLDVVYQGNVPQGQFIGTVPRNLNLSQVLEILASSDVHFKIEVRPDEPAGRGKKLIVTP